MLAVILKSYNDQPPVINSLLITVEPNETAIFKVQVLSFSLKLKYASYICYCHFTNNKK